MVSVFTSAQCYGAHFKYNVCHNVFAFVSIINCVPKLIIISFIRGARGVTLMDCNNHCNLYVETSKVSLCIDGSVVTGVTINVSVLTKHTSATV